MSTLCIYEVQINEIMATENPQLLILPTVHVTMDTDLGDHPIAQKPFTLPLKHTQLGLK